MNTWITIVIIILFANTSIAQITYFSEIYPNNTWGECRSVLYKDDTIYACTLEDNQYTGLNQIKFLTIDLFGNLISTKSYDYPFASMYPGVGQSFHFTDDGGFSLCGAIGFWPEIIGFIMKLDKNLDTIWMKTFESSVSNQLIFEGGIPTSDGGVMATGEDYLWNNLGDIVVVKVDSIGKLQWRKSYAFEPNERGYGICQAPDGGYVVTGKRHVPGNDYSVEPVVLKIDSMGNQEWLLEIGGELDDRIAMATISSDGNIVTGTGIGTWQVSPHWLPHTKIKLAKISLSGDIIWSRVYWSSWIYAGVKELIPLEDGSIVTTGFAHCDTIYGGTMAYILKVNSYGDSTWFRNYGYYVNMASPENRLYDIAKSKHGGFVLAGEAYRTVGSGYPKTPWVHKVDSNGCEWPGCDPTVTIKQETLNTGNAIYAFPNPCSDLITISYYIENQSSVILRCYNTQGCLVEELMVSHEYGLNHQVWDMSALPNGIYFYEIRADRIIGLGKIVLNR